MKKSIFALVMALVLCMSTFAMAETAPATFDFTAEEYVEGYTKFCSEVLGKDTTWSEPVETENLIGVLATSVDMNDAIVYKMIDDPACVAMYAECKIGMSDSDMTEKSQAFGMTVAAIPFATRYLEANFDATALQSEVSEMEVACQELVQKVFTSDAITSAMTEPYTETAVIGGHNAEMTLEMNLEDMTLTISFTYMP